MAFSKCSMNVTMVTKLLLLKLAVVVLVMTMVSFEALNLCILVSIFVINSSEKR